MEKRIQTYEEFWPFYVSQHRNATCRNLHFIGTSLVLACLTSGLLIAPGFLLAMPFAGYGFAWVGHFGFEKNRPATFSYPLWSFRADFRMYRFTMMGKMNAELQRAAKLYPGA